MAEDVMVLDTLWLNDAACTDLPLDAAQNESMQGELLSRCRLCPVRSTCLEYALERGYKWGVYGGTTGNQRRTRRPDEIRALSAAMGASPLEV